MRKTFEIPFYPFLIATYSTLALLATNISEVSVSVIVRPFLILLAGCFILLLLLRIWLHDWKKAGFLTGFWLLLFITYGHLYQFFEASPIVGTLLGRHRVLAPVFVVLAAISAVLIWRMKRPTGKLTRFLNILGVLMLLFPLFQVTSAAVNTSRGEKKASQWTFSQPELKPVNPDALPDVYYIVLDTYTSSKALKSDFGFENSEFEQYLEDMGFYVAKCSQTNYTYTQGSLTSTLNLDYLPVLYERLETVNLEDSIWILMKESLVRNQLERIGYKTVAFETSYDWSRIKDADIYLGEAQSSLTWQKLDPFERMWANTTALLLINDFEIQARDQDEDVLSHPWSDHISKQLFVLETLPKIADNPEPTFTFAHILIPHVPYVFAADGSILTDPGYFGTEQAGPINEEYLQKGYTGEVAFINNRMESILNEIIQRSEIPPIIVVMGDHGMRDANRQKIMYAVYTPDNAEMLMYPSISPVNTFRVIFDTYYGTSYGLLPDVTHLEDGREVIVPETCE